MIQNIWMEWIEHPTKLNPTDEWHISMIPFPRVTICPFFKIMNRKLDISSKFNVIGNGIYKLDPNLTDIE